MHVVNVVFTTNGNDNEALCTSSYPKFLNMWHSTSISDVPVYVTLRNVRFYSYGEARACGYFSIYSSSIYSVYWLFLVTIIRVILNSD